VVGAAAAGGTATLATPDIAQADPAAQAAVATPQAAGYAFLNLDEAAFVEALVDHMVPADEVSPKGTDLGVNIYIDRALAGAWGKGERLYMQGPWKQGSPSQGYQLPLTPAQLYRAGIEATNAHCRKAHGKSFDRIEAAQREEVLVGLSTTGCRCGCSGPRSIRPWSRASIPIRSMAATATRRDGRSSAFPASSRCIATTSRNIAASRSRANRSASRT
jgi:hypothetical protein